MRRREFIALTCGAAAAWPLAARAQQTDRMRRIAVLLVRLADDPEQQARIAAFVQGLSQLGWNDGRNVRIDIRWATHRCRRNSQTRGRAGRALTGRHLGRYWHRDHLAIASRRHALFRSCLWWSSTRSAPVSLRAWQGQAAMPPGSRFRIRHGRKMGGAGQRDRAPCEASWRFFEIRLSPSGIGQFATVQGRGAVAWASS